MKIWSVGREKFNFYFVRSSILYCTPNASFSVKTSKSIENLAASTETSLNFVNVSYDGNFLSN